MPQKCATLSVSGIVPQCGTTLSLSLSCARVRACTHVRVRACTCVYAGACVYACACVCAHACAHACARAHIRMRVCARVDVDVVVCVCACMRAFHVCVYASVLRVRVCVCFTCVRAFCTMSAIIWFDVNYMKLNEDKCHLLAGEGWGGGGIHLDSCGLMWENK